jgi:hypothetical protein
MHYFLRKPSQINSTGSVEKALMIEEAFCCHRKSTPVINAMAVPVYAVPIGCNKKIAVIRSKLPNGHHKSKVCFTICTTCNWSCRNENYALIEELHGITKSIQRTASLPKNGLQETRLGTWKIEVPCYRALILPVFHKWCFNSKAFQNVLERLFEWHKSS